ncbi:MAG: hypothetical protein ABJG94_04890, partial [Nitratireductor sp.]
MVAKREPAALLHRLADRHGGGDPRQAGNGRAEVERDLVLAVGGDSAAGDQLHHAQGRVEGAAAGP